MIHACLTHDIDRIYKTYQYLSKPLKAISRGEYFFKVLLSSFTDKHPYWGFDTIINIENQFNVKSTLFFLNESINFRPLSLSNWKLSLGRYRINDNKIKRIISYLDSNGWEIGVHGSYNSFNDVALLRKEKEELESIVGHEVIGIRQHYLNLNNNTWKYQNEVGFKYDSTWGSTKDVGFKESRVEPFFPLECPDFCEIPMNIMDYPFVNFIDKWDKFDSMIDILNKVDGYLVINFHNNNYYEEDFPNVKSDYIEIIKRLKDRGASFLTMKEAYQNIMISKRINCEQ